ncbi:MAG: hypothetical protein KC636_09220 [Myxococcales bacterium]|nr:hypothetical protein [Myxococcales bacterium]
MIACVAAMTCVEPTPRRDCRVTVWAKPQTPGARVSVIGSWDGWLTPGVPLDDYEDDDWQVATLDLPPGAHGYLVYEDGIGRIDLYNPLTRYWSFPLAEGAVTELEVSLAEVGDCSVPTLALESLDGDRAGVQGVAQFLAAEDGAALDLASVRVQTRAGHELPITSIDAGEIRFAAGGLAPGKHAITVAARDEQGRAVEARGSIFLDPVAERWEDAIVYHLMIDRFRGDGGAALDPPPDPGARAGGTLDGVLAELTRGSFSQLGVSTLWLSPVYLGPVEARRGRDDDHLYEGYHGYWVLDSRAVEPRLGGDAALTALVDEAHARGIRVLLDLVPNHVYEDHPRHLEPPGPGWFNESTGEVCVCGAPGCPWSDYIETCWFTPYLPDLRLRNHAVAREAVADALWWDRTFDVDGVRIDAVPMMPRSATRLIADALRRDEQPRAANVVLGEVFTGPGLAGVDALRYHLGPDGLDSVFDFPLMWSIRQAIAHDDDAGFLAIRDTLATTEEALAGSGATLASILGNHDTTRFASEALGDAGGDPWLAPPLQATGGEALDRLALAFGLVFTLPGAPVIYYGDEVGLAGAGDPDSRRVLPSDDALAPGQRALRERVRQLGQLRRCVAALRRGARRELVTAPEAMAFVRGEGEALVVASRAAGSITLPTSTLAPGDYIDALSGAALAIDGAARTLELDALALAVYLRAGDPCLP